MVKMRQRRWIVCVTLLAVVASQLACGGGEYAMVSPEADLGQQLKDEGSRVLYTVKNFLEGVLATVWGYVEGLLQDLLEMVGVDLTAPPEDTNP